MLNSHDKSIMFVPLDLDSLAMTVFVDAGSVANADSSSQLGFMITLMKNNDYGSIINHGSFQYSRVKISLLAFGLFDRVQGFDILKRIRLKFNTILDHVVPLHVYTDSRSLYDC